MAQESGYHKPRASADAEEIVDETAPLLPNAGTEPLLYKTISRASDAGLFPTDDEDLELAKLALTRTQTKAGVWATISVLLIGVFIANADSSLVLATYGKVASEFDDLQSGTWIISSFILAQCVVQPLYGKLSDIYGRKACLQLSYILFTLGTAFTGLGQTMNQVIAARVIQGMGSAGMTSMVSIIITDLVPLHEVATLRSYVNVLQTTGRSCGGVIGGALTQALGWRWAFGVQVPPTILAIFLVQCRLHVPSTHQTTETKWQKLKRVDFIGALFLCIAIFAVCFILDTGGQKFPWNSAIIIGMAIAGGVSLIAFVVSTKYVAEPIFPLRLMARYPVWTNYLIASLQVLVQFSLMVSVPIYFQVTAKASTAQAGAYLIPAFIGNTLGGLMAGYWIKKTGLYKIPTTIAPVLSLLAMTLCYTTWKGHTTVAQSFAILPGGMASGMVSSSAFVGLAAGVDTEEIAVASSGLYLFFNIGAIGGASAGSAVFQTSLKTKLEAAVKGVEGGAEIMRKALTDISYVQTASDKVRALIVPAYVNSFNNVNLMEISLIGLCLFVALLSEQKRLKR